MNAELMRKIDNIHDNLVPFVIEKTGRGERSYDIFSRLLKDRIVFIGDAIHDHTANLVIAQILFLVSDNRNQDINIYINNIIKVSLKTDNLYVFLESLTCSSYLGISTMPQNCFQYEKK